MAQYPEYKSADWAQIANDILAYWRANHIFEQSISIREGAPNYTFFEGPPSANGKPGIHHVMARTVKDIFCRYKTQQGYQVKRKGGWDTHGLPVELQVEKELGITKEDIGKKITIAEYNQKCRETVMRFTAEWNDVTEKMGFWVDIEKPYITYENDFIESCWWLLKQLYDKDLLYKGYTIQPYSPAAGTGLSSHELNLPGTYKMVKDTSITAQFKLLKDDKSAFLFEGDESVYVLAWTTTPWTLPSNSALALGKSIVYVKVRTFNPYTGLPVSVILAEDRVTSYFQENGKDLALEGYKPGDKVLPWQVVGSWKGSELLGLTYEQLMPYVQPDAPAFRTIEGDFVTTEDGTGIVHIAPTFGSDDFRVARQQGIPAIMVKDEDGFEAPLVNKQGKFVAEVTDFAGMYVKNYDGADESAPGYKSTDVLISIKLKEENKAFRVEKYEHTYPHCWRTDKPVLYYPMESWFIKTTAFKDRMVALNQTINWKPATTGTGRFGNWLENLVDWNLSRSRYWGTPLPIWRSADGKAEICIGAIAQLLDELKQASTTLPSLGLDGAELAKYLEVNAAYIKALEAGNADLHRPFVDEVVLVKDGKFLTREKDLVDVWFDSGAMPYAQWHYPFEGQDTFKTNYPADFIAEGVDQTRGWFFTLHALAVMLFDSVAFKNVIANGLVLDKHGNKMSKRLGNAVDPFETLATYGADPTRWYMITNAPPWDNLKFNLDGVQEVQRKFFGTLYNTYGFFALYANLDGFDPANGQIPSVDDRPEIDRWILSRLNTVIKSVTEALDNYEPTEAGRAIQDFVSDDLSNWYVRLNRKRFWRSEASDDKTAAFATLYTCLETVARLMAPIAPFYAERLFLDLTQGKEASVHFTQFPVVEEALLQPALESRMSLAQRTASLVHGLRKKHNLKVRQPLSRLLVPTLTEAAKADYAAVADIILSEVNIKEIEFLGADNDVIKKKAKPNFKRLGAAYGKNMKPVAELITSLDHAQLATIEQHGVLSLAIGDMPVDLTLEDIELVSEDVAGYVSANEGGITVALDLHLTQDLINEGVARDFVNRIQKLRKDKDLEVTDKIRLFVQAPKADIAAALSQFNDYISREVQAVALTLADNVINAEVVAFDEFELSLSVEVVNS